MLSASRDMQRSGSQITVINYNFDIIKTFVYFSSAVTRKNYDSLDIKRRIALVNRCYCDLGGQLIQRPLTFCEMRAVYTSHTPFALIWRRSINAVRNLIQSNGMDVVQCINIEAAKNRMF